MALLPTIYRVCTISLLGVVVGGIHSLFQPISLVPVAPPPLEMPGSNTPVKAQLDPRPPRTTPSPAMADGDITLDQARGLYQQGVMFVDARSLEDFTKEHIEGALHLPLEALEGGSRPDALNLLDPSAKIVIYCTGGDCHASHDVAIRLNGLGFKACYVLKDGFPAWKSAGFEVTGGAP